MMESSIAMITAAVTDLHSSVSEILELINGSCNQDVAIIHSSAILLAQTVQHRNEQTFGTMLHKA